MTTFTIHNLETAPEKSKPLLEASLKQNGMIANLHGVLAESPELLIAYRELNDLFVASSFDAEELTVVWQTINVEHGCTYCVPAHTVIAGMMKVDPALTEALRDQKPMPTAKLQALQDMTLSIVRNRGNVDDVAVAEFLAAGYAQRQILDIILGVSQKVISNYVNHIAKTPLDTPFQKLAWRKKTS
ncbi:carboxymuconolactone decarboxylase family protein [Amphritea opalescens]|uniref:Carboxymuconolactone decarboxylase family protein n=1 Tax=Amphritea opalescens TaxID=2490544 RepID=A0A430KRG3_9GAMM|nr:carboxymuconolactone decarboxylase family protein [Amphritea opalescens]RTE66060.1 carboxymuconolactone decarboxylase family protein [Amphritea opalescens]